MPTAREIMTSGIQALSVEHTAVQAAERLSTSSCGALPVCDMEGHLAGIVTDHELVVRVLAAGRDASTRLGDVLGRDPVTAVGPDDDVLDIIGAMADHHLPGVPVLDGGRVVGMVSQAEVAAACPPAGRARLVEAIAAG